MPTAQPLRSVRVTRYVTPLREGGSLPAIVEGDDEGLYVLKFRGAGQGPRALIAELIAGEIARSAGLPVPEIVLADLDPDLGRTEPDPEISSLIRASAGLNLAVDYLPSAVTFDPIVTTPSADFASRVVWFDAFVTNVDRTVRNTNLLVWHRQVYLIDHGASLYFHHTPTWIDDHARSADPFPLIRDHVLLTGASAIDAVDAELASRLGDDTIARIVNAVPAVWIEQANPDQSGDVVRAAYMRYLRERVRDRRAFVTEAARAR